MTIDLTIIPAKVTIVNNTTNDFYFTFFKTYLVGKVPVGDTMTLIAESSAALYSYYSQAADGVKITAEAVAGA